MSETLADILPTKETAQAIRTALAQLDRRRDAAIERRDAAERDRLAALRTPSMALKVVLAAEAAKHEALIDLDRVALLRHDLSGRLQTATDREQDARLRQAVADARAEVAAAAEALRAALPDYAEAAAQIVRCCHLADRQKRALEAFRHAALATLPLGAVVPSGFDNPEIPIVRTRLSDVSLPGLPGDPWLYGSPPPTKVAPHIYQNSPNQWGP